MGCYGPLPSLALSHLERYEEVMEYFDRVLAIDPDHWDALNNYHMDALIHKGLALFDLGRSEEAIGDYDRVLAIDPEATQTTDQVNNKNTR